MASLNNKFKACEAQLLQQVAAALNVPALSFNWDMDYIDLYGLNIDAATVVIDNALPQLWSIADDLIHKRYVGRIESFKHGLYSLEDMPALVPGVLSA